MRVVVSVHSLFPKPNSEGPSARGRLEACAYRAFGRFQHPSRSMSAREAQSPNAELALGVGGY